MSSRKLSSCSVNTSRSINSQTEEELNPEPGYPFALALRVRVVQIVCGIAGLVIGAVACLEERKRLALGLGVPAGAVTVLAAAVSIYYSRGFGGYMSHAASGGKTWGAPWRALGPTPRAALPLTLLWTAASAMHLALLAISVRTFLTKHDQGASSMTSRGVAGVQIVLSAVTLATAGCLLRLDLRRDAA